MLHTHIARFDVIDTVALFLSYFGTKHGLTNRILHLGGEARYSTSSTFSFLYPGSVHSLASSMILDNSCIGCKLGPPNVLAFRSFQIDLPTRKEQGVKTLLLLVALSYAEEA